MNLLKALLISCLMVFNFGCCSNIHVGKASVPSLMEKTVVLTAYVENEDTGETSVKPYCSGVFISEREILTARHCAAAIAEKNNVEKLDKLPMHYTLSSEAVGIGKEPAAMHLAFVVKEDEDKDLALLLLPKQGIPAHGIARLADEMPAVGEEVEVIGTPTGNYFTLSHGYVAAIREDYHDYKGTFLQIAGNGIYFGNSGGPAYNEKGELVGIADFLSMRLPGSTFFVAVPELKEFIDEV